jgi:cytochrome c553
MLVIMVWGIAYLAEPEYAYIPPMYKVLNGERTNQEQAFDVWGQAILQAEAEQLRHTAEGHALLSPHNGAVAIDTAVLRLGREAFYGETFGNEVFLTDIMGILNGPLTSWSLVKALWHLRGKGTTSLQVELAQTVSIGSRTFIKGSKISTGLDVPRDAYMPLGMKVMFVRGRIKAGITCAACHATVDAETKSVIEGAPNTDLQAGLLLALATNSAAYFVHTDIPALVPFTKGASQTVLTSDGQTATLPDPKALEAAVDATLLKWPPGHFDSMVDLKSAPTQIPDAFTLGDHPYGWSGFAAAGPFQGLSVLNNNVHALNSDALSHTESSLALFGIDPEVYLGTLLLNAATARYRFHPERGQQPSAFFATVDPTPGVPGVNHMVTLPTFPKASLVSPDGLWLSIAGHTVWQEVNAMAAWQNTLLPPPSRYPADAQLVAQGQAVFERAGCVTCHAGTAMTNNRIIPVPELGTEPVRAQALKQTAKALVPALAYAFDMPVPVPQGAHVLPVPTAHLDPEQVTLAFAAEDSPGGYKVPSLRGLYWTAPYLHDGGVAVGPEPATQLGMVGTLLRGILPDPANSLRALVDREQRQRVVDANQSSAALQAMRVLGIGHEFWVDATAGFHQREQDALVHYLLQ